MVVVFMAGASLPLLRPSFVFVSLSPLFTSTHITCVSPFASLYLPFPHLLLFSPSSLLVLPLGSLYVFQLSGTCALLALLHFYPFLLIRGHSLHYIPLSPYLLLVCVFPPLPLPSFSSLPLLAFALLLLLLLPAFGVKAEVGPSSSSPISSSHLAIHTFQQFSFLSPSPSPFSHRRVLSLSNHPCEHVSHS